MVLSQHTSLRGQDNLQNPKTSTGFNPKAASDRSIVIISTLPFSLTGRWGKYLRVVGIIEMFE